MKSGTPSIYFKLGLVMLLLVLSHSSCSIATTGQLKQEATERNVLLVMDIQKDFTQTDGAMPVAADQSQPMIERINEAINRVKDKPDWEVVYIGNEFSSYSFANLFRNFAAIQGSTGAELDERLSRAGGPYFAKSYPDAFASKKFESYLRHKKIGRIYIVGVFADQCVYYTAQGANNRGYEVRILTDAVAAANSSDYQTALASYQEHGFKLMTTSELNKK